MRTVACRVKMSTWDVNELSMSFNHYLAGYSHETLPSPQRNVGFYSATVKRKNRKDLIIANKKKKLEKEKKDLKVLKR